MNEPIGSGDYIILKRVTGIGTAGPGNTAMALTHGISSARFIQLSPDELHSAELKKKLPIRITPYYASLIDPEDPHDPISRTMVPVYNELILSPEEMADPLGEENQSPVPQLVHRYPDRVLFLTTGVCAAYCRYCTRSHMVSKKDKVHSRIAEWDTALDYIRDAPGSKGCPSFRR